MKFKVDLAGNRQFSKGEIAGIGVAFFLAALALAVAQVALLSWAAMLILGAIGYASWGFWQVFGVGILLLLVGSILSRA